METENVTTGFAWKPEADVNTKHVELLISKAEDIYQDHFDSVKYSTYNLEQWNSDGSSFCVCPSLEPGVYHFVFRVDNGGEKELKISNFYERTFLGNGRAVNYIDLLEYAHTDQQAVARSKKKITRSFGDSSKYGTSSTSSKDRRSNNSSGTRSCTIL